MTIRHQWIPFFRTREFIRENWTVSRRTSDINFKMHGLKLIQQTFPAISPALVSRNHKLVIREWFQFENISLTTIRSNPKNTILWNWFFDIPTDGFLPLSAEKQSMAIKPFVGQVSVLLSRPMPFKGFLIRPYSFEKHQSKFILTQLLNAKNSISPNYLRIFIEFLCRFVHWSNHTIYNKINRNYICSFTSIQL